MRKVYKHYLKSFQNILYFVVNLLLSYFFSKFFYNSVRFIDMCIFLFEGIKTKLAFINVRMFQLPGERLHYKENPREFIDLETSIPIYKVFFVINRSFVRAYDFYFRLANRVIQPISNFFEPLNKNRKLFYRYNIFPRKRYKERLISYHSLFIKKYFFYKMQKNLKLCIYILSFFIFLFLKNLSLSFLLASIICLNYFFVLFFYKIYSKKLKKVILGLKLLNYKNFNLNNKFYLTKGIPLLDTVADLPEKYKDHSTKDYKFTLQNEIHAMLKFLRMNIAEIFDLIKLKTQYEINEFAFLEIIKNLNLKSEHFKIETEQGLEDFQLFLKTDILEKTLSIVGYLHNWKLFSILQLYEMEDDNRIGIIYKTKKELEEKLQTLWPKLFNFIYLDSNTLDKIKYFFNKFDTIDTKSEEDNDFLLRLFYQKEHLEFDQLQIYQTKKIKKLILQKIIQLFSPLNFKLIADTNSVLNKMLQLFTFLCKENKKYVVKIFQYEFNLYFLNSYNHKKNFFQDDMNFDIFLSCFFGYSSSNTQYGISMSKYMVLIKNEKNIFNLEKYMNGFDVFIEDLLVFYFLSSSKMEKDSILFNNKDYFLLEQQFKILLSDIYKEDIIDDFKYYNDNLNNVLLFLLKKTQFKKIIENSIYRKKQMVINQNYSNYNVSSLCKSSKVKGEWKFFYYDKTKFNIYHKRASKLINYNQVYKMHVHEFNLDTIDLKQLNKITKNVYNIDLG